MKKNKKKNIMKMQRAQRRYIAFGTCLLLCLWVVSFFAKISLSSINVEVEKLGKEVTKQEKTNQSLSMKINELASLENIQAVANNEGLSNQAITDLYEKLSDEYYGEKVQIHELTKYTCYGVPHFYYNYYVFQYATGFSAAIAIAMRILKEGAPAVADYKKFLSSGGSQDPISLLKIAGVDMSSPKPVEQALEMFGQLLDEMEQLTN